MILHRSSTRNSYPAHIIKQPGSAQVEGTTIGVCVHLLPQEVQVLHCRPQMESVINKQSRTKGKKENKNREKSSSRGQ